MKKYDIEILISNDVFSMKETTLEELIKRCVKFEKKYTKYIKEKNLTNKVNLTYKIQLTPMG